MVFLFQGSEGQKTASPQVRSELDLVKQNFINLNKTRLETAGVDGSKIVFRVTEKPGIFELDMNPNTQTGKFVSVQIRR